MLARLLLLGLSALALSFAFAPFPLRFLAPVALIPLFWIIETESPGRVFRYGLFFGAAFFAFHLWWFWTLVVPVQPVTRVMLDIGVVLLFGYLGLWIALFALATRHLGLFWSPFIWAALEWLRSQSDMGFPWGLLGTSLTPYTPMIQGASLIGVYGISALVVWIGLMLYKTVWSAPSHPGAPTRTRGQAIFNLQSSVFNLQSSHALFAILAAVSIALPLVWGVLRLSRLETRNSELGTPWFRVGIVQPNVSPIEKNAARREQTWNDMLRLSRDAIRRGARVLIYPETATLSDITLGGPFADSLHALADSNSVAIVTGTPVYRSYGYMNGTVVIEPGRSTSDPYIKIHPAPFSEHFPFVDHLPILRKIMTADMGEQVSGKEHKVFAFEGDMMPHRVPFATPICFEGIFPELVWQFVRHGAELIVVVTNDGWFGKTPGPYQHCELMIMRAVENGVPLVRAANNGVSLVADPYGRVLAHTRLFEEVNLVQDVPAPLTGTPYRRMGDQFSYLSLLITGLLILIRCGKGILSSILVRRRLR